MNHARMWFAVQGHTGSIEDGSSHMFPGVAESSAAELEEHTTLGQGMSQAATLGHRFVNKQQPQVRGVLPQHPEWAAKV